VDIGIGSTSAAPASRPADPALSQITRPVCCQRGVHKLSSHDDRHLSQAPASAALGMARHMEAENYPGP
jgi:hypothetical protein